MDWQGKTDCFVEREELAKIQYYRVMPHSYHFVVNTYYNVMKYSFHMLHIVSNVIYIYLYIIMDFS